MYANLVAPKSLNWLDDKMILKFKTFLPRLEELELHAFFLQDEDRYPSTHIRERLHSQYQLRYRLENFGNVKLTSNHSRNAI